MHSCCSVGGSLSLSLSPTELVCDTESDHMTSVVAMFHTDCCYCSSSFTGFNPQLFTRPCNTSASSMMQTLVASAGKTSFITRGVNARRTVLKSSSSTCTNSLRLHSIIPSSRMSAARQKLQALGTQDDQSSQKLTSQEPSEFNFGTAHISSSTHKRVFS